MSNPIITNRGLERHLGEDVVVFGVKSKRREAEGMLILSSMEENTFSVQPKIGLLYNLISGKIRIGIYRKKGKKEKLFFYDYFSS